MVVVVIEWLVANLSPSWARMNAPARRRAAEDRAAPLD
jgi:hypothetical protein